MQYKMSQTFKISFLTLTLLIVPSVLSATWTEAIEIAVPFPFKVENTELPAGAYVLSTLSTEPNVLKIEHADDGAPALMALTTPLTSDAIDEPESTSTNPRLVFEQLADEYFLVQVLVPSRSKAWQLAVPTELEARMKAEEPERTSVEGREKPADLPAGS